MQIMKAPAAFLLPYPPSDNERYLPKTFRLSKQARHFRNEEVGRLIADCRDHIGEVAEKVQAVIYLYPANNRRDPANCQKILFDSLQALGILRNDSLIASPMLIPSGKHPSDVIFMELWPMNDDPCVIRDKSLGARWFDATMHEMLTGKVFVANHVLAKINRKERIVDWAAFRKKPKKKEMTGKSVVTKVKTITTDEYKRLIGK